MKKFIGYEFDAIVNGVTNFGVFVELENTVEGLVRIEHLPRGNYQLDERTYSLRSGKRSYTLGDSVKVLVLGVDMRARKIDMKIMVDKNDKVW
jgi:ribonuclease R